jgi:Domain of unknown function (DUF3786)
LSMMFEDRKGYALAESRARDAVARLDPMLAAAERGVEFDRGEGLFRIPMLGELVSVGSPGGEVSAADGRRVSGAVAIVALHYLAYRGEPARSEGWLAYRDMPAGRDFSRAFESMAEERLAERFGDRPREFELAAHGIGGEPGDVGECSFVIAALPRVPLLVVLWAACEDVGGAARILFRPSAPFYLHTEDLAALGTLTAERLVGSGPES